VAKHFQGQTDAVFHCYWRGCIRIKRSSPAFPHVKRLIKHVTEVHVNKSTGRIIAPERQKSKNYFPRKEKPAVVEPVVVQAPPPSIIQSVQHGGHPAAAVMQQQQHQPKMMSAVMNPASILNGKDCGSLVEFIFNFLSFPVAQAPPSEPLFVTVPPRPQRVLHSEAYIK
jgi:protein polybromo-1